MAGRKPDAVGKDILILIRDQSLFGAAHGMVETPGPSGGRLDKFQRHLLVVADIPPVRAAAGAGVERSVSGFCPGDADTPRLLINFDRGAVSKPLALIRQQD